ncbi:MAG: SRPBCC family protein [Flavobacteriales bacterium]|nr:SRPBCC family protein [Flavobacteriales bacterium]
MKVLKVLGILLLVIIGLGLIASLILPKEMNIEVKETIDAPMDLVWENVYDLKKADKWSPWWVEDENMKVDFSENEGKVGSWMSWSSEIPKVGKGTQTVTKIDNQNHLVTSTVSHGFGKGDVSISLSEQDGKVNVTHTYHQNYAFGKNLMAAIFGAEKMMKSKYTEGLVNLKELSEKQAKEAPATPQFEIKLENRSAMNYAGKKVTISQDSVMAYLGRTMPVLFAAVGKDNMVGVPCGMYFVWNETTKMTDMTAAIPLKGDKAPSGFEVYKMPEGQYAVLNYYGNYDNMMAAHQAINEFITSKNMENAGSVLEEYVTDPSTEPDQSKWLTRILYPIKMKDTEATNAGE